MSKKHTKTPARNTKRRAKAPEPRINRITAWIHGVINPLEEVLEREALNGRRRVASFQWRSEAIESPRYLRSYFSRAGGILLEDLATYFPRIVELEKVHDALVPEITRLAKGVFDALIEDKNFTSFVEENFRKVCDPKTMIKDVACDLVNDDPEFVEVEENSYRDVWNHALPSLHTFRETAGWQPLRSALKTLEEQSEAIRDELLKLRNVLAHKFDVPPAPLNT